MFGLHINDKLNDNSTDATNFGYGRPIPDYSTTIYLIYFCVSIKLIHTWIYVLAKKVCGVVVPIKRR